MFGGSSQDRTKIGPKESLLKAKLLAKHRYQLEVRGCLTGSDRFHERRWWFLIVFVGFSMWFSTSFCISKLVIEGFSVNQFMGHDDHDGLRCYVWRLHDLHGGHVLDLFMHLFGECWRDINEILNPLIFNFADLLNTLETNGNYVFEVCFGEYMFAFNNLAWWFILYLGYLLTALVSRMIFQL